MIQNKILEHLKQFDELTRLEGGQFGGILGRAGVGKTAFLIQLSLLKLLKNIKVLHLSLNEPINKVCLWYEEVFKRLVENIEKQGDTVDIEINQIWEKALSQRFIMTFKEDVFKIAVLEERLSDLFEQKIFSPDLIIADGFNFDDESIKDILSELKNFATKKNLSVWFTINIHRDEKPDECGIPKQLSIGYDMFDSGIMLWPNKNEISVKILDRENKKFETESKLYLNPTTFLILNR
ncbi:MAG: cytoplasmic protein [Desulfobacterales bacterium]|nr:cytoplasmic protein [Desulfobacterales bacterium]